jgi:glucosamine 6-phosphate synthetase-like amidotransferase/phosphosugar isomerase protein
MCGIAAVLLFPQDRAAAQWQAIREIFTGNLLANEKRGEAATGVAVAGLCGTARILKRALPASRFVALPEYQQILSQLGPDTTLLLGHTRLPTKGSPCRDENNHPIQAGPVIGVHNGHIENDDELFAACGCQRSAEVDSEILFRLIESLDPQLPAAGYLDMARRRIAGLRGQYTFLACDGRRPARLLVLKHHNPLCMHFHREWNALIFSSRYAFLRNALGVPLSAGILSPDQLMVFDAHRLSELRSAPELSLPLEPTWQV